MKQNESKKKKLQKDLMCIIHLLT